MQAEKIFLFSAIRHVGGVLRWQINDIDNFQDFGIKEVLQLDFGDAVSYNHKVTMNMRQIDITISLNFRDVYISPSQTNQLLLDDTRKIVNQTYPTLPSYCRNNEQNYHTYVRGTAVLTLVFSDSATGQHIETLNIEADDVNLFYLPVNVGSQICALKLTPVGQFFPDITPHFLERLLIEEGSAAGWLYGQLPTNPWHMHDRMVTAIDGIINHGLIYKILTIVTILRNYVTFFTISTTPPNRAVFAIVFSTHPDITTQSKGLKFAIKDNDVTLTLMSDPLFRAINFSSQFIFMLYGVVTVSDVIYIMGPRANHPAVQTYLKAWPQEPDINIYFCELINELPTSIDMPTFSSPEALGERILNQIFINLQGTTNEREAKLEMLCSVIISLLQKEAINQMDLDPEEKRMLIETPRADLRTCGITGPGDFLMSGITSVASSLTRQVRGAVVRQLGADRKGADLDTKQLATDLAQDLRHKIHTTQSDRATTALRNKRNEANLLLIDGSRNEINDITKSNSVIHEQMRTEQPVQTTHREGMGGASQSQLGCVDLLITPESNPGKRNEIALGTHIYSSNNTKEIRDWVTQLVTKFWADESSISRQVYYNGTIVGRVNNSVEFVKYFRKKRVKERLYFIACHFDVNDQIIYINNQSKHFAQLGITIYNSIQHPEMFPENEQDTLAIRPAFWPDQLVELGYSSANLDEHLQSGRLQWILAYEHDSVLICDSYEKLVTTPLEMYTALIPQCFFSGLGIHMQPNTLHNAPTRSSFADCQAKSGIDGNIIGGRPNKKK